MFRRDKNLLILFLILAPLAFFPLAMPTSFSVDQAVDPRFDKIPLKIGDWAGKDVLLEEKTYEILETRNILSRRYESSKGDVVDLLLVSSHKDRRVAHPPEVCYTSSHYEIVQSKEGMIEISGEQIPIKEFLAQDQRNREHQERVLYSYKVGQRFTANYYAQQFQFALDRLTRKETQVLLIRLSSATRGPFQEFLSQILPHLS